MFLPPNILDQIPKRPMPTPIRNIPDLSDRGRGNLQDITDRLMGGGSSPAPRRPIQMRGPSIPRPGPNVPNVPPRLNQSALDSIRERLGRSPSMPRLGRSYEDVVAAGGGGINPDSMFEEVASGGGNMIMENPIIGPNGRRLFDPLPADLGGDDMIMERPDMLETPPTGGMPGPVDATPTLGLDGKMYPSREEAIAANANFGGGSAPTQPTPPAGEMPPIGNNPEDSFNIPPAETAPPVAGDPSDPLSSLYGQIGVADEAGARDVIEKILAGQSDQLSQEQRDLLGGGIYRRIANRLGIKDREGNLITPLSSVVTGYDKTETPSGRQALQTILDMEDLEGGSGIELLLNFLQGRMRAPQPRPTGPFGTVSGRDMFQMPQMPYMPQPPIFGGGFGRFGGFGGYGGFGSPGMGGYMGMRPSLPYAGMSSPMFPSIFGMAPPSYYGGMPSMFGNYGGGFPIANRGQQTSN